MIYLARYDHEFAGELFQQVFTQISMTLNRNSDTLRGRLAHMLMSSKQH